MRDIESKTDFDTLLQQYQIVVLDHYGEWCGPCKTLAPQFEQLARQYESNGIAFAKCDANRNLFALEALPTIEIYVRGQRKEQVMGADVQAIEKAIRNAIGTVGGNVQDAPAPTRAAQNPYSNGGYKPSKKSGNYRTASTM